MKKLKLMWPDVAGSEWMAYGHVVKVSADGSIESHPDVLELYAKNLGHRLKIIAVDDDGAETEVKIVENEVVRADNGDAFDMGSIGADVAVTAPEIDEDATEVPAATPEPEKPAEPAGGDSEPGEEKVDLPADKEPGKLDDVGLRALAEEHGVKLGRAKNRDKIVAKLAKAGVVVPGE
jgi:hypothetical protein